MAALDGDVPFHAQWPYAPAGNHPIGVRDMSSLEFAMTSEERREARYRRRVERRAANKARHNASHDSFDKVFSYCNLYQSYRLCRKGVAWKASVQRYITQAPLNVMRTHWLLMQGRFRTSGFSEFDLIERGKPRHIKSVTIGERVVQRCLCDHALVPVLTRTFIHDNGACMEGKGYSFSIRRLTQHLREHYRKYGQEGYILLFDFSRFFDNVSHEVAKATLAERFSDERIVGLTSHFIDAFGERGLGLGSQISQVLALASANKIDHWVKEVARIRGYGRYMDDGYLIHPSKNYLRQCLAGIRRLCEELGITLNTKKTQIVKLSHGFTYLKARWYLLPGGRVLKKLSHHSVTCMRRKLKALRRKVADGSMTYEDVHQSLQSWRSYAQQFDAHESILQTERLFDALYAPFSKPSAT